MGEAIGQLLPFAVGVAVSPMPIVAVVLMLVDAPRADQRPGVPGRLDRRHRGARGDPARDRRAGERQRRRPSPPHGWTGSSSSSASCSSSSPCASGAAARTRATSAATPKWMGALDAFTPVKALGAAAPARRRSTRRTCCWSSAAPRRSPQTGISTGDQIVAWAVFTLIASLGVGAAGRHLLRPGRPRREAARRAQDVAGAQQHGDHGRPVPDHRRQAHRRRDHRLLELTGPRNPTGRRPPPPAALAHS